LKTSLLTNFKDEELHSSFQNLTKIVLNHLNDDLNFQIKELFSDFQKNAFNKIFKKYFSKFKNSPEYKNFESVLIKKYAKNFSVPTGTSDNLWQLKVEDLVENIFVDYLWKYGLTWQPDILEDYYSDLEKYLIDNKIRITVITPVIGLQSTESTILLADEISLTIIPKQREIQFQGGTDVIKYAFANYDLKFEYLVDKLYEKIPEENNIPVSHKAKIVIQNIIIIFRLYRKGRVGVIDSDLLHSVFSGSLSWQNPRCGLPKDWRFWNKPKFILEKNDIEEIQKLRIEIQKISSRNDNEEILRSIDRFMTSYEQDLIEDRILDLIISLESLLQNEIDELRYKLSIRTAKFLGNTPEERNTIYKTILVGYSVRNKTAHGKELPTIKIGIEEITLEVLADRIEEYVRNSIKKMIKLRNDDNKRKTIIDNLDSELFLESSEN